MTTQLRPLAFSPWRSTASTSHRDARARAAAAVPRRRGRPLLVSRDGVLAEIRSAHAANELFRIHDVRPALYARARRLFGSWSGALRAAGLDPAVVVDLARRRATAARMERQRAWRARRALD